MQANESLIEEILATLTRIRFFSSTRELLVDRLQWNRSHPQITKLDLLNILETFNDIELMTITELCGSFDDLSKSISDLINNLDLNKDHPSSDLFLVTIDSALNSDHEELLAEFNFTKVTPDLLTYLGIR